MNNDNNKSFSARHLTGLFFVSLGLVSCTGTKINLSRGCGEVANEFRHCHQELNVSAPLMEIMIPIMPGKHNAPVVVIEGLGRAVQTVTTGQTDARMNLDELFAGVGISAQQGRIGLVASDTYYVLTAEGYGQLTNLLKLRGGITHRNAHQAIPRATRFKSTQVHAGVDFDLGKGWTAGVSYHTGNIRRAFVHDSVRFNVGYEF